METFHTPVLPREAIEFLNVRPGKKYIDATVGGGGHAVEIVKRGGVLLGLDVDPEAVELAKKRLGAGSWKLEKGNFKDIEKIAKANGFYPISGILYDLGLSSYQLENSGRGFSFLKDEPLDMRADPKLAVTAADLLNALSEKELAALFEKYGEERFAKVFSRAIVRERAAAIITSSKRLAEIITGAGRGFKRQKIHPATRVFQALRIAVNDELQNLQSSLPQAFELLDLGGRLAVISFHSLEDRVAKNFAPEGLMSLTKKPVTPGEEEILLNPRSRSAKLRAWEKVL